MIVPGLVKNEVASPRPWKSNIGKLLKSFFCIPLSLKKYLES